MTKTLKYFTYSADIENLKTQYRTLARQHHPDLRPDDKDATKRMQEVNAEFDSLVQGRVPNRDFSYHENMTYAESLELLKKMKPEMVFSVGVALVLGAVLKDWANKRR